MINHKTWKCAKIQTSWDVKWKHFLSTSRGCLCYPPWHRGTLLSFCSYLKTWNSCLMFYQHSKLSPGLKSYISSLGRFLDFLSDIFIVLFTLAGVGLFCFSYFSLKLSLASLRPALCVLHLTKKKKKNYLICNVGKETKYGRNFQIIFYKEEDI